MRPVLTFGQIPATDDSGCRKRQREQYQYTADDAGIGSVSDESGSPPAGHPTELAMPPDTVEITRVATRLKRPKTMWKAVRVVQWNAMVATGRLV